MSMLDDDMRESMVYGRRFMRSSIWDSVFNIVVLLHLLSLEGADRIYEKYAYSDFIERMGREEI